MQAQRQAERNRQAAGPHPSTVASALVTHLSFLDQHIATLEQAISDHIERHPDLKRDRELLTSIRGIGERTATRLLAELGDRQRFADARAWAAYAGLTPRQHRSGSSVHGRTQLSKVGNAALRAALCLPAIVAKQHNPVIRAFCARLAARGLAPKAVIGAALRKLLHLAYGVLKAGSRLIRHGHCRTARGKPHSAGHEQSTPALVDQRAETAWCGLLVSGRRRR